MISANFSRLGETMFSNTGDWECALTIFADLCVQHNITWYITGSVSEAILGVNVTPHDLDIVSSCDDFYKLKEIFSKYIVEPYVDNNGEWVVRYFGIHLTYMVSIWLNVAVYIFEYKKEQLNRKVEA